MSDDKIVDLKKRKFALREKAHNQTMDRTWNALVDVWTAYADEVRNQQAPGELCLSDEPYAVFSVLLEKLVGVAHVMKLENKEIIEMLEEFAELLKSENFWLGDKP